MFLVNIFHLLENKGEWGGRVDGVRGKGKGGWGMKGDCLHLQSIFL